MGREAKRPNLASYAEKGKGKILGTGYREETEKARRSAGQDKRRIENEV
jgi:hypothetical protein